MALVLSNAQSELHPLEIGLHALRSGLIGVVASLCRFHHDRDTEDSFPLTSVWDRA
jgi:hypothetical protein